MATPQTLLIFHTIIYCLQTINVFFSNFVTYHGITLNRTGQIHGLRCILLAGIIVVFLIQIVGDDDCGDDAVVLPLWLWLWLLLDLLYVDVYAAFLTSLILRLQVLKRRHIIFLQKHMKTK